MLRGTPAEVGNTTAEREEDLSLEIDPEFFDPLGPFAVEVN
jgi:hypothetical protein